MNKDDLSKLLKIEEKKKEVDEINRQISSAGFWNDSKKAAAISQKLAQLNEIINKFEQAETPEQLKELEKEALFSGEYDEMGAILSIHAGAGGTEAQDWAQMLERMYLRYCETKGFKAAILNESSGDEAGIKSAEIEVEGFRAYGHLKAEAGVHRLVRISPYDADKSRHTSFVLVEVVPDFDEVDDIKIDDKDLKIDVYRASGHGGQSVNTTDSAVRITHLPTKIVVSVQNERSQLQNKETALKILKAKLKKKALDEQLKKERELKGGHISAEWGNQIRSYVLQPYQQVKDHRTDYQSSNPQKVLDGQIDDFILEFLKLSNK
ncbi:MAG: peptide chain release factor 2 [Bacillota bacterium]